MNKKIRIAIMIIIDIILIIASFVGAFLIRFDGVLDPQYIELLRLHLFEIIVIKIVVIYLFKLYKSVWCFAGIDELVNVVLATVVATTIVLSYFFLFEIRLPRSIFIISAMLDMFLLGGVRLSYRFINRMKKVSLQHMDNSDYMSKNVMIIGAGDAGAMIIKELRAVGNLNSRPVALIDDDPMKMNQILYHIPVVGNRHDIVSKAQELAVDEIIIAIPSAERNSIREIVKICEGTKAKLKIVPGVYEMIDGQFDINAIRDVQIEDLLGRDEVQLDIGSISEYLEGKVVLVTGAGGSIGSELVRQIARFTPSAFVLIDIYENNLYDLQNELRRLYPDRTFDMHCLIASVRDRDNIQQIMARYKPDVVFHAAAHKHVPLMEDSPKEAIKNNILGTFNVANAAHLAKVKRFVMISTDKAVNPTNVMGATKRVCEMIIQAFDKQSETEYVGVRFGNVLGSNGSVIPLFKNQIKEAGYVTLTHPDIIRYFMTIPEAAKLVIQSGGMARGGELFVLDMGEPVKIIDLARDLIRLSGFEPEVDIPIKIVGLRPGEKLYEELLMDEEGIQSTRHEKIFIGKSLGVEMDELKQDITRLKEAVQSDMNNEDVVKLLMEVVPTFNREG